MDIFFPAQTLPLFQAFAPCFTAPSFVYFQSYVWALMVVEGRKCLTRLARCAFFHQRNASSWSSSRPSPTKYMVPSSTWASASPFAATRLTAERRSRWRVADSSLRDSRISSTLASVVSMVAGRGAGCFGWRWVVIGLGLLGTWRLVW